MTEELARNIALATFVAFVVVLLISLPDGAGEVFEATSHLG